MLSDLKMAFSLQFVQLLKSCPLHVEQLMWQVAKEQSPFELNWNPELHRQVWSDWRAALLLQDVQPNVLVEEQVAQVLEQLRQSPFPSTMNPATQVHVWAIWL